METKEVQPDNFPKILIVKGVFIVALFLLVVFGIWHFSSGIRADISKRGNTTTTAAKKSAKETVDTPETLESSYYNNWIKFAPGVGAKETYPEKEYLEIDVVQPNLSGTDATKWVLENSRGEKVALGPASALPLSGKVNAPEPLKIKAGDHLIVSTGRSPVGVSFRVNKCSAYLEQFQDFVPPISGVCPYITSEKNFYSLDTTCQRFVQDIRPCETNTRPLPSDTAASCKTFLDSTTNYNGCVATHKNDPDFYSREWRIFLGKEKEMWAEPKDTILLLDDAGKRIDALKY